MHKAMVSVFDSASQQFTNPMFFPATGAAMRAFRDEVNGQPSQISQHPEDFELYHLGTFDDNTGRFDVFDEPRILMRGKDARDMSSTSEQ